jgi:hypothetical protein
MSITNEILNKHLKVNDYTKGNRRLAIFMIGIILIGIGLTHIIKILKNKENLEASFECKKCKNEKTGQIIYKKNCSNSPDNLEVYQKNDIDHIKYSNTKFCDQVNVA